MNICVFGASSDAIDNKYITDTESLCEKLACRGHSLIFGAGCDGLMGAAARGFKKGGAKITGVIPEFFGDSNIEITYKDCDEIIYTTTMSERKQKMIDMSDAFLVVPGGIGTFDEFFEILTLKQLGRLNSPITLYDSDGYYEYIQSLMKYSIEKKFLKADCIGLYEYLHTHEETVAALEKKAGEVNINTVK